MTAKPSLDSRSFVDPVPQLTDLQLLLVLLHRQAEPPRPFDWNRLIDSVEFRYRQEPGDERQYVICEKLEVGFAFDAKGRFLFAYNWRE